MIIMVDECLDLGFEVARQVVVSRQDAVFQGLMPALDLALGLRMERGTANVAHLTRFDIFGQFACDIAGTVVRQYTSNAFGCTGAYCCRCVDW